LSKLLNETRKLHEQVSRQVWSKELNPDQLLQTIRDGDSAASGVAESRLQACRKIRLAPKPHAPLILAPQGETAQLAVEAYRALRTRVMRMQAAEGFRSLVISSAFPGEGKTLITLNLALCYAQLRGMRVLLVDGDLRTRGLSALLGCTGGPGVAGILEGSAQPEQAVVATDVPNLYVLETGTPSASPPELFSGSRWKEFIGWASESFKLILVDSPPVLPLADFELITAGCGAVLVVVRALQTQREVLQRAVKAVDSKKLRGVILNGIRMNGLSEYYSYYMNDGVPRE
jgi:capsular exopolysaccharide synthesis family protein